MHFCGGGFGTSKKILTLGLKDEVQPHPKALQLQRMVRYTATLFIQVKCLLTYFSNLQEVYKLVGKTI